MADMKVAAYICQGCGLGERLDTAALAKVAQKEGKAALRPVQLGDWIGSDWVVLDGLAAGDRVIVDNLLKLHPGVAVSPLAPGQGKPAESGTAAAK